MKRRLTEPQKAKPVGKEKAKIKALHFKKKMQIIKMLKTMEQKSLLMRMLIRIKP
jgi:hypothetical protein